MARVICLGDEEDDEDECYSGLFPIDHAVRTSMYVLKPGEEAEDKMEVIKRTSFVRSFFLFPFFSLYFAFFFLSPFSNSHFFFSSFPAGGGREEGLFLLLTSIV